MKLTLFVTACLMALTANQLQTAEASPPPEVGGQGACVNPGEHVYRCNTNQEVDDATEKALVEEILKHKANVQAQVEAGEIDTYMEQFTTDVRWFYNDQSFFGYDEVKAFITGMIGGGKSLTIDNIKVRVMSERHVVIVNAEWHLGGTQDGFYYHEDYYKQADGTWICTTIVIGDA